MSADPRHAPWASDPGSSRGRLHEDQRDAVRGPRDAFQRDRDRIIHSISFRRLRHKTQVFMAPDGDHFRVRLTHSLEVAQIGRTVARALGLNEDLTESLCLAHDIGHPPFGHAGEDALKVALQGQGGFDHNGHTLRALMEIDSPYPRFNGLNLTFETREGVLKHCSAANARRIEEMEPGGVARRFLDRTRPGLEAQLCNLADEIAYNAHDIDDGVRSGLITLEQLAEVPLFEQFRLETLREFPALQGRRVLYESIRRMLSAQVYDVIDATRAGLAAAEPADADAVRSAPALVKFSNDMATQSAALKSFLLRNLYRHPQVMAMTGQAKEVVRGLFAAYLDEPAQMPPDFAARPNVARAVADYIAGMTDRFAAREHERLTGAKLLP